MTINEINNKLISASKRGNIADVQKALANGASLKVTDSKGNTPLHHAVESGSLLLVQFFLFLGVHPNLKNTKLHLTPLHLAASHGHASIVEALLKNPLIKKEAKDKDGNTPFQWACLMEHLKIAEIFLKYKANIDTENKHGEFPLFIACKQGNHNVIKFLKNHGAFFYQKQGSEHLLKALKEGNETFAYSLLKAGIKGTLEHAIHAKTDRMVKALLKSADPKNIFTMSADNPSTF